MPTMLLRFLKSNITKYAIIAIVASGAGLYLYNTIQENGRLEERLENAESELDNARQTLESERKQFKQTLSNYDDLMSDYMDRVVENQSESQRLRQYLSNVEDTRTQECLNTQVDEEFLNQVFRDGSEQ